MLATRDYADVVLVDIKEGLPQGKALDIAQMGAVLGYEPNVSGSNDYDGLGRLLGRRDHRRRPARKTGAMAKTDGIYGIRINHLLEVR